MNIKIHINVQYAKIVQHLQRDKQRQAISLDTKMFMLEYEDPYVYPSEVRTLPFTESDFKEKLRKRKSGQRQR